MSIDDAQDPRRARWASLVHEPADLAYSVAMRFRATVELGGKTATGFQVPDRTVAELGSGKRPPVRVTLGGHTYRTMVFSMDGRFMVPLSAENRAAAGLAAGDDVEVDIALDLAPREVSAPRDLTDALAHDDDARQSFDRLAYTHRKEWVRWIEDAKKAETRSKRIETTVAKLRVGQGAR